MICCHLLGRVSTRNHGEDSASRRLDSITANASQNNLGVGSSGISDKTKAAVRWAKGQCVVVDGGRERKKLGGDRCKIEGMEGRGKRNGGVRERRPVFYVKAVEGAVT